MRIAIDVVVSRKRGRTLITPIERKPDEVATQGVGLQLDEVKALMARLQQIVAT